MKRCSLIKNISPKDFFLKKLILLKHTFSWLWFKWANKQKDGRIRLIWAILLCVGFPVAISLPFVDTYVVKHVAVETQVSFEYTNGLLSIASVLFGFSSLIIISKEWVDKRAWAVLLPPLALIVVSGVSISQFSFRIRKPSSSTRVLFCCF